MSKNSKPVHFDYDKKQDDTAYFGYRKVKADDKVKLVQLHFDSIARKYDSMNTLLSFGLHHLWKGSAINMLDLQSGDKVIDVCGGTADLAIMAAKVIGSSGRVLLYDINKTMMELGRFKVSRTALSERIQFVQGDAEQISLPDNHFDAAMVGFGIRNLTRIEKGLAEMHRVLKPNGKFMCLEFSRPASPVFRHIYDFYSFFIMPRIGKLFTGSSQAYRYLPESIRLFPSPEALSSILEQIGFCRVAFRRLTNGIAVIHTGIKEK
jgi:demethylmenaquinone methyltransferase/2-methoxy-6-polyprenyl-1,4-benzoquinol methylase